MDEEGRWKRWAAGLGWGGLVLLLIAVVIVIGEQISSDFYYFDEPSVLAGLAAFFADVLWLFFFYLALPALGGLLSLIALVWLVAYASVRWGEFRTRRSTQG